MSIDVEKSDRGFGGRFSELSTRPDQDYGVAWVKGYGKGRTYFTPLGHTTIMYTDKRWTGHLLAAIQYLLGDIEHRRNAEREGEGRLNYIELEDWQIGRLERFTDDDPRMQSPC